jgi:hypothetical protein
MKIIKKVDVSNWNFHTTCSNCETEMEADKDDVKCIHHASSDSGGYGGYSPAYDEFCIHCPVCQNKITVPTKELPKLIQVEVKKKNPLQFLLQAGWIDKGELLCRAEDPILR